MFLFVLLQSFKLSMAVKLNGGLDVLILDSKLRTFAQLEDLAAQVFNLDPEINSSFTAKSWSEEFMNYGCYCNKLLRGGGRLPSKDNHEELCMDLYACYKCINIDYDHTGTYAATKMVYEAIVNTTTNSMQCQNELHHAPRHAFHDHDHAPIFHDHVVIPQNCPRNICECDRTFINKALDMYKKCKRGHTEYCLNDKYRKSKGWKSKRCLDFGVNVVDHDACCGDYPFRRPYVSSERKCCHGQLTLNTVC